MKTHNYTRGLKGYATWLQCGARGDGLEKSGAGRLPRGTIAAVAVVETVTMFSRVCKQL